MAEQACNEPRCVALIPAYNPDRQLPALVASLVDSGAFAHIVVVNDGSHKDCGRRFDEVRQFRTVTVVEHAVNLGKGAALKSGLNHVCCRYDETGGIVTADADGQHLPRDVISVAAQLRNNPRSLVVGARTFQTNMPLRSRVGNVVTKAVFRAIVGCSLLDTQSGLRGIPVEFARQLLRVNSSGYDFELDMLIQARSHNICVRQLPITTVYEPGNKSSHFNPLRDSLMIYLVFARFMFASMVTAILGLTAFQVTHLLTGNLLASEISLCVLGVMVNFTLCRRMVFRSRRRLLPSFMKFLALVCAVGTASYLMTWGLTQFLPIGVLAARIVAALILYLANFAVQREFIFEIREASHTALGAGAAADATATPRTVLAFPEGAVGTKSDSISRAA